jgi:hypothetical protein
MRGAIVADKMYFPNNSKEKNITLGPAIIRAYDIESKKAKYPRIIIDHNLYREINQMYVNAYPFGEENDNLKEYIKCDEDSLYFLELFNKKVIRRKDEQLKSDKNKFYIDLGESQQSNYYQIIRNIRRMILLYMSRKNCEDSITKSICG